MPTLNTIDRIGRLQQRMRELEEGKEIDATHIDLLLGDKGTKAFDADWKRQKAKLLAENDSAIEFQLELGRERFVLIVTV